jgi:long-chain acyl-CoA synthetase
MAEALANTPYSAKPWLKLYAPGLPATIDPPHADALSLFRAAVARAPDGPALLYFDGRISYRELDEASDALAPALIERGFEKGDRLAVMLQNMPAYYIASLAAWKAGGIVVSINPMNREHELRLIFADCDPKALVCLDQLHEEVIERLPSDVRRPPIAIVASARDYQTRNDPRIFGSLREVAPKDGAPPSLSSLIARYRGRKPAVEARPARDDIAFLVYTSGTTGLPKGAVNTHGNVAFNAQSVPRQYSLQDGDAIFALAPLFHITGIITHVVMPWALAAPAILVFRFDPGVVLDGLVEHKPAWMVSAITAFITLMNHKDCAPERFASLKVVVSGGAPMPPSVVEEFERRTGYYIHNGYGLTETSAGVIAGPHGARAPVDPASGALSIGTPLFNVDAWIADENGAPAPVGHVGEIVIVGPTVSPGYWRKPVETAESMKRDGFRTGDVGFMDEQGWFYLVDRKKDVIIASGYKVWPREVEDVLYSHPAVREVAVIGAKDAYRGETVKAFVSLKAGHTATSNELAEWCRDRIAAYKRPHQVDILDDLPKTVTGKILRRMLK